VGRRSCTHARAHGLRVLADIAVVRQPNRLDSLRRSAVNMTVRFKRVSHTRWQAAGVDGGRLRVDCARIPGEEAAWPGSRRGPGRTSRILPCVAGLPLATCGGFMRCERVVGLVEPAEQLQSAASSRSSQFTILRSSTSNPDECSSHALSLLSLPWLCCECRN
jgi:hypothetical protein